MTSVLVVEDDPMLGRAVGRDLADYGFAVDVVSGHDEAVAVLASKAIDVLLADLRLGTSDGIDLLEEAREISPRTRAVLMSGFATARDYQRAIELGAVRVLCKPFTRAELLQCIRQAIECETGFRGSFHGLSLVDLLQMFNYARRSVAITVGGHDPGKLFLRDGQLIHAEHRGKKGEAALASILVEPAGSLVTSVVPETVEQSITSDFREALLDALRHNDEVGNELDARALDFMDDEPQGSEGETHVANAKESLPKLLEIDGCIGACIVDSNSGMMLGAAGGGTVNLEVAAAGNTEVVRAKRKTMKALAINEQIEDILITLGRQYHIIRPLSTNDALFVYLVLDRSRSNLAMARHQLAQIEKELTV
jgi:DNA-binding response OmpR family regulator